MGTIPTRPTFTAHTAATAADMEALGNVVDFWAATPKCFAYNSAGQSLADNTETAVALDTEIYDNVQSGDSPMHDVSTNNTRIYIRTSGMYFVSGQVTFAPNASGVRNISVQKNGGGIGAYQWQNPTSGHSSTVSIPVKELPFTAGDYVELYAFQTSGGNLTVGGDQGTFLALRLSGS